MYFGTGIVKTVEDFGSQGEWPSHPELLDWLATEFVRTGWDVKAMQKLIVTSAAYRQSSKATPELVQRDPENRLLARGPRFRLPAEMIRDQALSWPGCWPRKLGGPSVKPYQPDGLWKELAMQDMDYVQSKGADLYRRSLYTFWKRTIAPPMMMNFDAAQRESLRGARNPHQYAAAGAEPDERRDLCGGRALPRPAHDEGRRARRRLAPALRLPPGARAPAVRPRNCRSCATTCNYHLDYFAGKRSETCERS